LKEVINIKTIGLTGGIACGKSSVIEILTHYGIKVISADDLVHQMSEPGGPAYAAIVKQFGNHIVGDGGQINRRKLGEIIFADNQARSRLESITHPIVIAEIKEQISQWKKQGFDIVVVEVPLLFEVGITDLFDQVWVVSASTEKQLQRLQTRDHLTVEEAERRISAQLSLAYKEGQADVVIINNQGLDALTAQVQRLINIVE
jgi:dephospho-CoA kinase